MYAHFGSKEELQLATIDEARQIFEEEVIEPAKQAAEGVSRLVTLCDGFFAHLERRTFPGGCFFAGAVLEMSARPGRVRESVAAFQAELVGQIREFAVSARRLGQLRADEDVDQLVFELNGLILAANAHFVLHQDGRSLRMARQIVRKRLGMPPVGERRTRTTRSQR